MTLERVTFAYAPDRPVLQDVDLRIAPGRFVALVGPSGSGKSTLIGLILRLWEPSAGRLLVDDVDVRDYRVGSVRSQIAVVTQDTLVFAGTVAENVACGADGITDSMIVEACRQAGADEFIRRLPHGYESLVGERGADLSRGQRQRLAIARALLRQAPILILDEPTTGLDPVAADRVRDAIQALPRGTTTLLVTHDRSLAELADECHELDRGVVRPFDRHNTAAALKGGLHV